MIKLNSHRYHPLRSGRYEDDEDFDFMSYLTESLYNVSDINLLLTHRLTGRMTFPIIRAGNETCDILTEQDRKNVLSYYDKAPEIHPDNHYGKKGESV